MSNVACKRDKYSISSRDHCLSAYAEGRLMQKAGFDLDLAYAEGRLDSASPD